MGEDLPDCELNVLTRPLQHFGYPWCHSEGSGSPMQRSPGVSRLVRDPDVNKDGKAFDCKGEGRSPGTGGVLCASKGMGRQGSRSMACSRSCLLSRTVTVWHCCGEHVVLTPCMASRHPSATLQLALPLLPSLPTHTNKHALNPGMLGCTHDAGTTLAAQPMGPHVTPLGMTFYRPPPGNPPSLFPSQYHNQIFVAQRGSWNRWGAHATQLLSRSGCSAPRIVVFLALATSYPISTGANHHSSPTFVLHADSHHTLAIAAVHTAFPCYAIGPAPADCHLAPTGLPWFVWLLQEAQDWVQHCVCGAGWCWGAPREARGVCQRLAG
jgi:hypothetical protein